MSRGGSYGGGQSSLGYLFGSDEIPIVASPAPAPPPTTNPPFGVDSDAKPGEKEKRVDSTNDNKNNNINNSHRSQGQYLGNFLTDRPSTRVKSVPGGDSSLGYLFGDK